MGEMTSEEGRSHGATDNDVSGWRLKIEPSRANINRAEAENIVKAVTKYLAKKPSRRATPFDVKWFKRLHKEMFGDVWSWAGSFRQEKLNFGIDWFQIEQQLFALSEDIKVWTAPQTHFDIQAAMIHHRAVFIHPFRNGNGRWARLLANIWLKKHEQPIVIWPDCSGYENENCRNEYLKSIRAADQGDYDPLLAMQRRYFRQ